MKKSTVALLGFLLIAGNYALAQHITVTIAGNGYSGGWAGGMPSLRSSINSPQFVCTDGANNVYYINNGLGGEVQKVSYRNGIVTTIAGGGSITAYGVAATSVSIAPTGMCTDAAGNVYIMNWYSRRVDRVDAVSGNIYPFAGTSSAGYGGDRGPATSALFNSIDGICTDNAGNVYIVDAGNQRIRKVNVATGVVTAIAGTGSAGYSGDGGPATAATISDPAGYICCNSSGDVFFSDQTNTYIRRIDAITGIISTYAGGGTYYVGYPALSTDLLNVTGMCMDAMNNICWSEMSCSIRQINHITDTVSYIGGNVIYSGFVDDTNSLNSLVDNPAGMTADGNNNIYIADEGNNRIRKLIYLTNTPTFAFGKGQVITPCPGYSYALDSVLWIADIDYLEAETWTVISAPLHGSVGGFPTTALSNGTFTTTKPTGVYYTSSPTYSGMDSFKVMISDGVHSDTITIYAEVQPLGPGLYVGPVIGADTLCAGASSAFSDSGAAGVWSLTNSNATISGFGIVNALSQGTNTLNYTVTNGCGTYVATKRIMIDSFPIAGIITGATSVCDGYTITLADGAGGGVWRVSNGNASVSGSGIVSGVSAGTDTIIYSVTNSCGIATTTQEIMVSDCDILGINNLSAGSLINVFPNPATNDITIVMPPGAYNSYTITNNIGQTMITSPNLSKGEEVLRINVTGLPSGMYYITFRGENGTKVEKFVKM